MLSVLEPITAESLILADLVSPTRMLVRMIASNLNGICEDFCRVKNISHEDFEKNGLLTRRADSKNPCKVIWEIRYKNKLFFRAESTPLTFGGEKIMEGWV